MAKFFFTQVGLKVRAHCDDNGKSFYIFRQEWVILVSIAVFTWRTVAMAMAVTSSPNGNGNGTKIKMPLSS